jgi:hypothetical protein
MACIFEKFHVVSMNLSIQNRKWLNQSRNFLELMDVSDWLISAHINRVKKELYVGRAYLYLKQNT